MKCKHIIGKVLGTNKKDYHYTCIKCGSIFSKEQINGYLIKDWRIQAVQKANSNMKVNKKTLKNLKEWRKENGKKKLV